MDSWLTDGVKQLLFQPCFAICERVGSRLDNRVGMRQDIDERAITEDLVDSFDTTSNSNAWGTSLKSLHERQIFINTQIHKSTREFKVGADIGIMIRRRFYSHSQVQADYACLVQCKKVSIDGYVSDFFHQVHSSKKYQSSLMLDITPSSFYFVYVPPSFVQLDYAMEPLAFARVNQECSSPVWNMGCFEYNNGALPFLSEHEKRSVSSILVIPALAVEAQINKTDKVSFRDILPNCIPFWYWFGELLIPGFIGDRKKEAISAASNTRGDAQEDVGDFGVSFSLELSMANG